MSLDRYSNPEARREYMKKYRAARSEDKKERQRKVMRARSRALTALSALHPKDFERLLSGELKKEGLNDVQQRGPSRPRG